jgi:uncharacterized phiE125 gp8 family phage protein
MIGTLHLVDAPDAGAVVSLAEAKAHCRVDIDDDDALIEAYIAAAVQALDGRDGWLGRALGVQSWEYRLPCFPEGPAAIWPPLPPLIAVASLTYFDAAGDLQTLDPSAYEVGGIDCLGKGWIVPVATWPATARRMAAVAVSFSCGYEPAGSPPASTVPAPIRLAVLRQVATAYDERATVTDDTVRRLPGGYEALLAPYKVW